MSTKLERLRGRLMALETELQGMPTYYLGPQMHAQFMNLLRTTRELISALTNRLLPADDVFATPNSEDE